MARLYGRRRWRRARRVAHLMNAYTLRTLNDAELDALLQRLERQVRQGLDRARDED